MLCYVTVTCDVTLNPNLKLNKNKIVFIIYNSNSIILLF